MMSTYLLTTEDVDPHSLPEPAVLYVPMLTRDAMEDQSVRKLMAAPQFVRSDRGIPYAVIKDMHKHRWTLIRAWREFLEIKRDRLAGRLGMTVAEYKVLENGLLPLSPSMLGRVAQGRGLDESQLELPIYQTVLGPMADVSQL